MFEVSSSDLKKAERNTDLYEIALSSFAQKRLPRARGSETSAFWSLDGKTLDSVANRDGAPQVYGLPIDGGEARITDFVPGISSPLLLAGGKTIVFASAVYPECGTDAACHKQYAEKLASGPVQADLADSLLLRHWTGYREFQYSHLFACDLETGKVTMLTSGRPIIPRSTTAMGADSTPPPTDGELCVVGNHDPRPETSTNSDLFLLPLDGQEGPLVKITGANKAFDGDPLYSPDGKWIAYRTQAVPGFEADRFRLALYDRTGKTTRILTAAIDDWAENLKWTPDSKSILFLVQEKGRTPLYRVGIASGKTEKLLTANSIREFVVHPDGKGVHFIQSSVGRPVELWTARFDGKTPRRLTTFNQALENEVDIRPAEEMWVKGANGRDIHVFVVKPHGFKEGEKYPLIVNVHGGPQRLWSDAFRGDWQVYPGAGYMVAFPNPHGSTGYGQDFTTAISRDWSGKVTERHGKVTDHLARLTYVDADRMGAMGWSWGGYAMMWLEGTATRFKALASMMGVYDLRSMHGATEELWFPQWDLKGTPWTNAAGYEQMSPSTRVANFKTPCLVITGERDYRVPYTQSLHFFTDLQSLGVPPA